MFSDVVKKLMGCALFGAALLTIAAPAQAQSRASRLDRLPGATGGLRDRVRSSPSLPSFRPRSGLVPGMGQPFSGGGGGPNFRPPVFVAPGMGRPLVPTPPAPSNPSYVFPGMGQPLVPTPPPPSSPNYYVLPGMGQPAFPASPASLQLGAYGEEVPGVGIYLTTVFQQSSAEQMGLEAGDTIVQINGAPIRTLDEMRYALATSGGYVRLLVLDNRSQAYQWVSGYLQ